MLNLLLLRAATIPSPALILDTGRGSLKFLSVEAVVAGDRFIHSLVLVVESIGAWDVSFLLASRSDRLVLSFVLSVSYSLGFFFSSFFSFSFFTGVLVINTRREITAKHARSRARRNAIGLSC